MLERICRSSIDASPLYGGVINKSVFMLGTLNTFIVLSFTSLDILFITLYDVSTVVASITDSPHLLWGIKMGVVMAGGSL